MSDLARLEHITKNLDDHIQQRAEQVAAPRIAEAQAEADKRVRALELDLKVAEQRRDDLRQEYRRQIGSLERQRDRAREEVVREAIRKVQDPSARRAAASGGSAVGWEAARDVLAAMLTDAEEPSDV